MPTAAPRPCLVPGCPHYGAPSYCAEHKGRATGWKRNKARGEWRADDPAWRRLRLTKLRADPWCELKIACPSGGAPATEVHHVIPVAQRPDLKYSWENLQSACEDCHKAETSKARNNPNNLRVAATKPEDATWIIG